VVAEYRDFLASKQVYLAARGYRVLAAESPEAALALLETETPAIIFLDLMMEHVDDGLRLGHRIGKDERLGHVPRLRDLVESTVPDERRHEGVRRHLAALLAGDRSPETVEAHEAIGHSCGSGIGRP